jgi:hypothetical protein
MSNIPLGKQPQIVTLSNLDSIIIDNITNEELKQLLNEAINNKNKLFIAMNNFYSERGSRNAFITIGDQLSECIKQINKKISELQLSYSDLGLNEPEPEDKPEIKLSNKIKQGLKTFTNRASKFGSQAKNIGHSVANIGTRSVANISSGVKNFGSKAANISSQSIKTLKNRATNVRNRATNISSGVKNFISKIPRVRGGKYSNKKYKSKRKTKRKY